MWRIIEVHDQRIAPRPLLGFEEARDRRARQGVGAEPIHGLGREGDEPARGNDRRTAADTLFIGREEKRAHDVEADRTGERPPRQAAA